MTIKDGKIVKISESELFDYWLECWSDIYPFSEYKQRLLDKGVEIVKGEQDG